MDRRIGWATTCGYMGSLEEHVDDELSGGSGLTPADIEGYGRALYGGMPYEDVATAVKEYCPLATFSQLKLNRLVTMSVAVPISTLLA